MIIVIYAGYQSEPLNPSLINTTGLGGTEQVYHKFGTTICVG